MRLQFRPSKTQTIGRNYEKNLLSNPVGSIPLCRVYVVYYRVPGKGKRRGEVFFKLKL